MPCESADDLKFAIALVVLPTGSRRNMVVYRRLLAQHNVDLIANGSRFAIYWFMTYVNAVFDPSEFGK